MMSHEQPSSSAASITDTEHQLPAKSEAQYPSDTKSVTGNVVGDADSDDMPDDNAQYGVKAMEGVTLAWTKKTLGTAYIL